MDVADLVTATASPDSALPPVGQNGSEGVKFCSQGSQRLSGDQSQQDPAGGEVSGPPSTVVRRREKRGPKTVRLQHLAKLERETRKLQKARDPRRRIEAVRAIEQLATHNTSRAVEALVDSLQDVSKSVRLASLQAIRRLARPGDPAAMNAVATLLEQEDWERRQSSCETLPALATMQPGDPNAVIMVDQYLKERKEAGLPADEDLKLSMPKVSGRQAAQESLLGITGDMDAVTTECLSDLLGSDVRHVRITAASSLGRMTVRGDHNALQAVASRLGHHSPDIRSAGTRVLRNLCAADVDDVQKNTHRVSKRSNSGLPTSFSRRLSGDKFQPAEDKTEKSTPSSDESDKSDVGSSDWSLGSGASNAATRSQKLWTKVRAAAMFSFLKGPQDLDADEAREEKLTAAVTRLEECYTIEERCDAILALARDAPRGEGHHLVVPPLMRLASDDSWQIRVAAFEALGKVAAPKRQETLQIVAAAKADSSWQVRKVIPPALREIGKGCQVALDAVVSLCKDWKEDVCVAALYALPAVAGLSNPVAIEALVASLIESPRTRIRNVARINLDGVARRTDKALVDAIALRLEHDEASFRSDAVDLLAKDVGGADKLSVVAALTPRVTHWNGHVRKAVQQVLGMIRCEDQQAVDILCAGLQDSDYRVRAAAVHGFSRIGRTAKTNTVTSLAKILDSPLPHAREAAIEAAVRIAHFDDNATLVEPLKRLLEDEHAGIKRSARLALLTISPAEEGLRAHAQALQAAGSMLDAKAQHSDGVEVTRSLVQSGNTNEVDVDALNVAMERLSRIDAEVRQKALRLISLLAPEGHPASLDGVVDLFRHEDSGVRSDAIRAFLQLAPRKWLAGALRMLSVQASSSHFGARICALTALGALLPPRDERCEDIVKALEDTEPEVQDAAAEALGTLESRRRELIAADGQAQTSLTSPFLPSLLALMRKRVDRPRIAALEAIHRVACPSDVEVLVEVASILEDPDAAAQALAAKVLRELIGNLDEAIAAPMPAVVRVAMILQHPSEEARLLCSGILQEMAQKGARWEVLAAVSARFGAETWPQRKSIVEALLSLCEGPILATIASLQKVLSSCNESAWTSHVSLVLKKLEAYCGRLEGQAEASDAEADAIRGRKRIRWHTLHGSEWALQAVSKGSSIVLREPR